MRHARYAVGLVLVIVTVAWTQPTPKIYWDHDGVDVSRFECVVDGGTPSNLGLPIPSGTTYSTDITNCTGVMVNGQHSLVIQACNAVGCTAAAAIAVVKL